MRKGCVYSLTSQVLENPKSWNNNNPQISSVLDV